MKGLGSEPWSASRRTREPAGVQFVSVACGGFAGTIRRLVVLIGAGLDRLLAN